MTKAPNIQCLKDMENCSSDVTRANLSMTMFQIHILLIPVVSGNIADEYNCPHDSVLINQKKLVKELKRDENKLKSGNKSVSDLQESGQAKPPTET